MHSKFETVLKGSRSDIDYNGHVHQSVYPNYLLYARVDQGEVEAEGHSTCVLIDANTRKPVRIPDDLIQKYSI